MTDQPTEGQPATDETVADAGAPVEPPSPVGTAPGPSATSKLPAAPRPAGRPAVVEPPYVAAARVRKRVPLWAVPIFPLLLVWALVYVNAMKVPPKTNDPIAQGAAIYTSAGCAGCHGATGGGGGNAPAFTGGGLIKNFPKWQDQVQWVNVGAANWGKPTYGAQHVPLPDKAMPGFGPDGNSKTLTCSQIVLVVNYERHVLGGESPGQEADLTALSQTIANGQTPSAIPNCPLSSK